MNNEVTGTQKGYSSIFKAKIALLALKKTNLFDLAQQFNLNEALIRCWKEELLESLKDASENNLETQMDEIVTPESVYTLGPEDVSLLPHSKSNSNDNVLVSQSFEKETILKEERNKIGRV